MARAKKPKSTPARTKYAWKKVGGDGTWWRHKLDRIKRHNGFKTDEEAIRYRESCQKTHGPKGRPAKRGKKKTHSSD